MAGIAMDGSKQAPQERAAPRRGPEAFTWIAAAIAGLLALLSEPIGVLAGLVSPFGALGGVVAALAMALFTLACGWIGDRASRRAPGWAEFIVSAAFWAVVGAAFVINFDLFSRLAIGDAFTRAMSTLELVGLISGAVVVLMGLALVGALTARGRIEADITRREQDGIALAMPGLIGQGLVLVLISLARPLDWAAPSLLHGAILFLAGAAIFASFWFTTATLTRLDELERNLAYRQCAVCVMVFMALLALWALGEALGIAPALDAFGAYLLLNLVSFAIALPWTIWTMREEA